MGIVDDEEIRWEFVVVQTALLSAELCVTAKTKAEAVDKVYAVLDKQDRIEYWTVLDRSDEDMQLSAVFIPIPEPE